MPSIKTTPDRVLKSRYDVIFKFHIHIAGYTKMSDISGKRHQLRLRPNILYKYANLNINYPSNDLNELNNLIYFRKDAIYWRPAELTHWSSSNSIFYNLSTMIKE